VKLSKEDDEKEEKLRTLSGLLESVIIFIRKQDYERLQKPIQLTIKPLFKEAKSPFFGLIDELSAYGGIDRDFLLYHFSDLKDEPFNVIATKITKLLKDTEAEAQKKKDRLKKLEVDKKPKELEALKKKLSEIEAKKQQEMQEKLLKIKEIEDPVGGSMAKKESLIEKVVRENITEASNRDLGEVVPLLDLLKGDDKRKENIEKIITDKVGAFSEDNLNDEAKNKSDEALNKEFYKQITNFDE
jgi:Skp family chaperone for outer membrane proteins